MLFHDAAHHIVPNGHHRCGHQRAQAVVHHIDEQAVQIWNVAGEVERHDLPLAVGGDLVAGSYPFNHQANHRRPVAEAHDIIVRAELPDRAGNRAEESAFLRGEGRDGFEPTKKKRSVHAEFLACHQTGSIGLCRQKEARLASIRSRLHSRSGADFNL
jgi:hypothetical protein